MFKRLSFPVAGIISLMIISPTLAETEKPKLRVGLAGAPPFVIMEEEKPKGISLDIWREVAEAEDLDYELIPHTGVRAGIEAVKAGELDILIGPISITATRLEEVRFTQPYFTADIGLLVANESPTVWSRIKPFFRVVVFSSIGVLFLSIFFVGNLIWLAEHKHNPEQFPKSYLRGIEHGMWFAFVTMTTVGYGDKAPVTTIGRMITSIWMMVTMVTISSLTAGLATAFTLSFSRQTSEIFQHPLDIEGKQITVISGTTGQTWAENYQARLVLSDNFNQAIERLLSGQAQGFIFDVPALKYYLYQNPRLSLKLASVSFASEKYGFVLPLDSEIVQRLNIQLVRLQEEGKVKSIQDQWLRIIPD